MISGNDEPLLEMMEEEQVTYSDGSVEKHQVYSRERDAKMVSQGRRMTEARMKGYEGEACPECQSFTLLRNGSCMKCDTCGSTTGCS